jgi:hypothetical protein
MVTVPKVSSPAVVTKLRAPFPQAPQTWGPNYKKAGAFAD